MIYTVSCQHNGKAPNYEHNRRTKKYIEKEMFTSVDLQRPHYTYVDENIKDTYRQLFGASLEEWNKKNIKNKHSDRVISFDDWFEKIKIEGNQYRRELNEAKKIKDVKKRDKAIKSLFARPRLVYEAIIQFGNMDTVPPLHTDERKEFDKTVKQIFDKYIEEWKENNPTLHLTGVYYHFDEISPHVHVDYIPVVENQKSGMKTAPKLKQAYLQLGCEDGHLSYTPQMQWQDHQRDILIDIAKEFGLEAEFDDRRRRGIKTLKQYGKEPFKYKIDRFAETDKLVAQEEQRFVDNKTKADQEEKRYIQNKELADSENLRRLRVIKDKDNQVGRLNYFKGLNKDIQKDITINKSKLSSLKNKIQSLESYSKSIIDMATLEANEVIENAKKKGKELIEAAKKEAADLKAKGTKFYEDLVKESEDYYNETYQYAEDELARKTEIAKQLEEDAQREHDLKIKQAENEAKKLEDDAKEDAKKIIEDAKNKKKQLDDMIKLDEQYYDELSKQKENVINTINQMKEDIKSNDALKEKIEYERVKAELSFYKEKDRINTLDIQFNNELIDKYANDIKQEMLEEFDDTMYGYKDAMNKAYAEFGFKVPYPEILEEIIGDDGPSR